MVHHFHLHRVPKLVMSTRLFKLIACVQMFSLIVLVQLQRLLERRLDAALASRWGFECVQADCDCAQAGRVEDGRARKARFRARKGRWAARALAFGAA